MNEYIMKKGIVLALMLLFLGAGTLPAINGNHAQERTQVEATMENGGRYVKTFDQPPVQPDETPEGDFFGIVSTYEWGGTSGLKIHENFMDTTGKIDKIIWWGLCMIHDGKDWLRDLDPEGMNFYIEFYEDNPDPANAPPEKLVYSFDVNYEDIQVTHTGIYRDEINQTTEYLTFEYVFPETLIIPDGEGWIAIQSHDHPEGYWFLLIASNVGDGFCYRKGSTPNEVIGDVAIEFYEYELDTTPPEVSFYQPKDSTIYLNNAELFTWPFPNAVIIGNIDIIIDAWDDVEMDYVEIFIDGESKAVLNSETYVWKWDETGFGSFTIRADAFDWAGNSATVEIMVIKIF